MGLFRSFLFCKAYGQKYSRCKLCIRQRDPGARRGRKSFRNSVPPRKVWRCGRGHDKKFSKGVYSMLVIPAIDLLEGNVVRLVRGNPDNKVIYGNDPVQIAKKWENAGADMLHVVDLDATLQTGRNNTEIVSRIINEVDIPVEVAGGIRTIPAAKDFFSKNAAKVVIGTMAYKNPDSIKQ